MESHAPNGQAKITPIHVEAFATHKTTQQLPKRESLSKGKDFVVQGNPDKNI